WRRSPLDGAAVPHASSVTGSLSSQRAHRSAAALLAMRRLERGRRGRTVGARKVAAMTRSFTPVWLALIALCVVLFVLSLSIGPNGIAFDLPFAAWRGDATAKLVLLELRLP